MQLTLYTDYSLRVLAYLSLRGEKLVTISEVAEFFDISRNHLVKVVHNLAQLGYIITTRGKSGGMRLARPAEDIIVGDVVRHTEPNFHVVECFNPDATPCAVVSLCNLKQALADANNAFLRVLDAYTVADIIDKSEQAQPLLQKLHFFTEKPL